MPSVWTPLVLIVVRAKLVLLATENVARVSSYNYKDFHYCLKQLRLFFWNWTYTEIFVKTLPISCWSYRNLNFEIRTGVSRTCRYPTQIIPYNIITIIQWVNVLAKFTFPIIVYYSGLGIHLVCIYFTKRKLLLYSYQKKKNSKIDRSPYSFTRKWRFTTLATSSHKEKADIFFSARAKHAWNDARCSTKELTVNRRT